MVTWMRSEAKIGADHGIRQRRPGSGDRAYDYLVVDVQQITLHLTARSCPL